MKNDKDKILVSAIISTYNSEKFIKGRIENLLAQSIGEKLEIIIVNSGSQEDEAHIINKFQKQNSNIRYIETAERETIYKSWNRAIKIASGKYITNANTDDRLRDDSLEIMSGFLDRHPDIYLIYADQYISKIPNEDFGSILKKRKYIKPDYRKLLLLERCIIGSQPMWRAALHSQEQLYFDEKYKIASDYDFELKISEKYGIFHLREVLGIYYLSPSKSNVEYQNPSETFTETYEIMFKHFSLYLSKLKEEEVYALVRYFEKHIKFPGKPYNLIRKFSKMIYPYYEPHSLAFAYWALSLCYSNISGNQLAKEICIKGLKKLNSKLLQQRIYTLTKDA